MKYKVGLFCQSVSCCIASTPTVSCVEPCLQPVYSPPPGDTACSCCGHDCFAFLLAMLQPYSLCLDGLYWQCCSHILYAFGQAVLAMLQPYSPCFWTGRLGNVAANYCRPLDRLCLQCSSAVVHAFGLAVLAMLQPYSLCL